MPAKRSRGQQPPKASSHPLRLDPALSPGRFRSRETMPRLSPLRNPLMYFRYRKLPDDDAFERARRLTVMGDPLADDFALLYPELGYARARAMLDQALDEGIEAVADAPDALRALFADVDRPPAWVDWKRVERGAAVMRRYAPFTWLFSRVAFAQTFVNANAGTPLYMTGSLNEKTVARRLKETARWRLELHQPSALRRDGAAFKTVVRVRVLHALIRLHLIQSGEWDTATLGMPIPQMDMAGANIGMFLTHSLLPRLFGARISSQEFEDVLHLWRYQGHLIGLVEELNPPTSKEWKKVARLLEITLKDRHDPRGETLTRSTMRAHLRREGGASDWMNHMLDELDIRVSHGIYFLVNGNGIFQRMGLTQHRAWALFPSAVFPWVFAADSVRKLLPGGTFVATELGSRYVTRSLADDIVKNAPFNPYHATT